MTRDDEFHARIEAISRRLDGHISACSARFLIMIAAIAAGAGLISTVIAVHQ